jgi:antitoxin component YwqK of YwqJK toxin-antitoxin module
MSKKEKYIEYYDNGKKRREGTFKDGEYDGVNIG